MTKLRSSFRHAWHGIILFWRHSNKARIHGTAGTLAIGLGLLAGITFSQWALIALCIALVLGAEMVNEAFERLCDHLHPEQHAVIGQVKDISAGAVLVMSIAAALVGLLVLGPALWVRFL